jgi:hypothetical protein
VNEGERERGRGRTYLAVILVGVRKTLARREGLSERPIGDSEMDRDRGVGRRGGDVVAAVAAERMKSGSSSRSRRNGRRGEEGGESNSDYLGRRAKIGAEGVEAAAAKRKPIQYEFNPKQAHHCRSI